MKKEQMQNLEQMPNDVGLIPGTFIMPTGRRLPSLTDNFGLRFSLEKYRLWLRIKEIFGYVVLGLLLVLGSSFVLFFHNAPQPRRSMTNANNQQSPLHGLLPRQTPRRLPNRANPLDRKIPLRRNVLGLRSRQPLPHELKTLRKHSRNPPTTHCLPRTQRRRALDIALLDRTAKDCVAQVHADEFGG